MANCQRCESLLALVDQLRQERDAARERVQWFERSGGVAAHARVFQEMNRADRAEEACARLRTALENVANCECLTTCRGCQEEAKAALRALPDDGGGQRITDRCV